LAVSWHRGGGTAWLIKLVPEAAAASASLAQPLRSLCRMLDVEPPLPAPPRSAKPKPPAKPAPARKPPSRSSRPRYVFGLRYPPPLPDPA